MSRVLSAAMASECFPGKMLQIPLEFVTLLIKHKHIMILETFCFPKMLNTAENTVKTTVDHMLIRCCCCSSCHKRIDNLNFFSVYTR